MKWLLDTNVVSESTRLGANRQLMTWMGARGPEQLALSVVSVAELRDGASRMRDDKLRQDYLNWFESDIISGFEDRVLPLTLEILIDWLSLARKLALKGRPKSAPDLMIAATARVHDLIIASRNVRDFAGTDTTVYNPWTGETHHMAE